MNNPDFSHLSEVDYHPEQLCNLLMDCYRASVRTGVRPDLRWQYLGGNEDGQLLLCAPMFPNGALHVMEKGGYYVPAYNERRPGHVGTVTRPDPLDISTKRRNPSLINFFVRLWRGQP